MWFGGVTQGLLIDRHGEGRVHVQGGPLGDDLHVGLRQRPQQRASPHADCQQVHLVVLEHGGALDVFQDELGHEGEQGLHACEGEERA